MGNHKKRFNNKTLKKNVLISYSLIKIYIFGNDYFISSSLVLNFLFNLKSLNAIT